MTDSPVYFPEQPLWAPVQEVGARDVVLGGQVYSPANRSSGTLANRTFLLRLMANMNVKSATTVAPSDSDPDWTLYIVPPSGGENEFAAPQVANQIAFKFQGVWSFLAPAKWITTVDDQPNVLLRWNGTAWVSMETGGGGVSADVGHWDMNPLFTPVTLAGVDGFTVDSSQAPIYGLTPSSPVQVGPAYVSVAMSTPNVLDGNLQQASMIVPAAGGNAVLIGLGVCNSGATQADLMASLVGGNVVGSVDLLGLGYIPSFGAPYSPTYQAKAINGNGSDTIHFAINTTSGEIFTGINAVALVDSTLAVDVADLPSGQTLRVFAVAIYSATPGVITGGALSVVFSSQDNAQEGFGNLIPLPAPDGAQNGSRYWVIAPGVFHGIHTLTGDVVEIQGLPDAPTLIVTRLIDPTQYQNAAQVAEAIAEALAVETARAESAESALSARITAEVTRAENAETTLQESITSEQVRATNAEGLLNSAIGSEQSRALTAETALGGAITTETGRATTAEAALAAQIATIAAELEGIGSAPLYNYTADHTLVAGDISNGGASILAFASASPCVLTIPLEETVPAVIGYRMPVIQASTGMLSITAATGVTLDYPDTLRARKRGSVLYLTKIASDHWVLSGDTYQYTIYTLIAELLPTLWYKLDEYRNTNSPNNYGSYGSDIEQYKLDLYGNAGNVVQQQPPIGDGTTYSVLFTGDWGCGLTGVNAGADAAFSVMALCRLSVTALAEIKTVVSSQDGAGDGWTIAIDNTNTNAPVLIGAASQQGGNLVSISAPIVPTDDNFVALTGSQANGLKLWLNGQVVASAPWTGPVTASYNTIMIACQPLASRSNFFDGDISHMAYFQTELTPQNIAYLARAVSLF